MKHPLFLLFQRVYYPGIVETFSSCLLRERGKNEDCIKKSETVYEIELNNVAQIS
jgi:hypothetical protein